MPTFLAAPHVRRAAGRLRTLRANPHVAVTIDTETFPPEVSEVEVVGFHTLPSLKVRAPRIAESLLHFECKLHRTFDFGIPESRTMLVVGEVVMVHCAEGVLSGHRIDHDRFNPLGRIAGRSYCKTGDTVHV